MTEKGARVCIIGGGWCGVQALQSLRELGVEAELYESHSALGGCFAVGRGYVGLGLHSQRWLCQHYENGRFFPFAKSDLGPRPGSSSYRHQSTGHNLEINSKKFMDAKASGDEMGRYITRFAHEMGLESSIYLNSFVEEIQWEVPAAGDLGNSEGSGPKRDTWIVVKSTAGENAGKTKRLGPFDIVYLASFVSNPILPDIPIKSLSRKPDIKLTPSSDDQSIKVMHHWELSEKVVQNIMAKNKKVIILGSGKGSTDAVCFFARHNYHSNFEWLAREPYFLWHYSRCLPDRHSEFFTCLASRLRGIGMMVAFASSLISGKLFMAIFWALGCCFQPKNEKNTWFKELLGITHLDDNRFNFGLVCSEQLPCLLEKNQIVGDIDYLHDNAGRPGGRNQLVLKDGRKFLCDVLVCATGYGTGIERIKCVRIMRKSTSSYEHQVLGTDLPSITQSQCYDHMTAVDFPPLVYGVTCLVQFGPVRGVFQAAYVAHRIRCKYSTSNDLRRDWDPNYMASICNQYWFQPNALLSHHPAFRSTFSLPRTWVAMFVDLIRFGRLSVWNTLEILWGIFMSSNYVVPLLLGARNPGAKTKKVE